MQRHSLPDRLRASGRACAQWFRAIIKGHAQRSEWAALPAGDRLLLAADIGISQAEVDSAVHSSSGSRELVSLLGRPAFRRTRCSLGVLRDMQRVCGSCTSHDRCRSWQASACSIARWPAFCPNGYTLASLRRSEKQHHSA